MKTFYGAALAAAQKNERHYQKRYEEIRRTHDACPRAITEARRETRNLELAHAGCERRRVNLVALEDAKRQVKLDLTKLRLESEQNLQNAVGREVLIQDTLKLQISELKDKLHASATHSINVNLQEQVDSSSKLQKKLMAQVSELDDKLVAQANVTLAAEKASWVAENNLQKSKDHISSLKLDSAKSHQQTSRTLGQLKTAQAKIEYLASHIRSHLGLLGTLANDAVINAQVTK
jgi:hypothetical protein